MDTEEVATTVLAQIGKTSTEVAAAKIELLRQVRERLALFVEDLDNLPTADEAGGDADKMDLIQGRLDHATAVLTTAYMPEAANLVARVMEEFGTNFADAIKFIPQHDRSVPPTPVPVEPAPPAKPDDTQVIPQPAPAAETGQPTTPPSPRLRDKARTLIQTALAVNPPSDSSNGGKQ